jgi:phosphatidylserine/phosphatidylglycerophosphate/cardiolipin synthase-like enzyme
VLTENWKPSGTGGHSSRGWGAVVRDPAVADRLASVFRADSGWRDGVSWEAFREGRRFEAAQPANGTYPTRTAPRTVRATGTELLVAPDNAGRRVRALVGNATDRVRVLQVSMDRSFARPLLQAARRGVSVRVLLSSAWYVREENRALADRLNRHAEREDLDLTVRLARPDGYGKVHAKGMLVDGETVGVGSLNWNEAAATENREVVVVLHGTAPASYYGEVFARDWRASGERGDGAGGATGVPAALVGVAGVAVVVALVVARRIEFGDGGPVEGPWRE